MLGLRVSLASVALLLVLSSSVLSLSVSASASGAWLRHRLAMKPLGGGPNCVPLKVVDTENLPCPNGCTLTRGRYQDCLANYFINDVCRYTWVGPDGVTCVDLKLAQYIFLRSTGFCTQSGSLKGLAFQLLTAELNADPAIGNAFASDAVLALMQAARELVQEANCPATDNSLMEEYTDRLEAFNKGQAEGSAGHCENVEVTCPTGTLEAESGYNFGPVYGSVSSSLTSTVQWSASGLPPNFVINAATGAITATPAGDVTEETTYNFKLFAKYPVEGENWNGGTACCSITVYPAYQGKCFEAEGEYPRPTFAIGTSTSLFTVTHSGGASPVGPLTLAITAVPTDATPATLPPAISFTSPVADDPRTGTLSGLDADETPPAIGIYTYSLSAVDKLLHTHTVTDCEFEVVPKYEVACFAAESGDPTPTFAVGGASQSFVVEATGGADPIGTPLTFTLTSRPPEAPASPDMPPLVEFSADGRKGTLSGKATDAAFKGDYTYSLSTTDRLGNVASVQDCIFKVLASDLFTTGCTYTIGFYKNKPEKIFTFGVTEIKLGPLTFKKDVLQPTGNLPEVDMVAILSFLYSLKLEGQTKAVACLSKDPVGKSMAQALAAQISIAHGASATKEVTDAIELVGSAMKAYGCGSKIIDSATLEALKVAQTVLDTFNNGLLAGNPPHCFDSNFGLPPPPVPLP